MFVSQSTYPNASPLQSFLEEMAWWQKRNSKMAIKGLITFADWIESSRESQLQTARCCAQLWYAMVQFTEQSWERQMLVSWMFVGFIFALAKWVEGSSNAVDEEVVVPRCDAAPVVEAVAVELTTDDSIMDTDECDVAAIATFNQHWGIGFTRITNLCNVVSLQPPQPNFGQMSLAELKAWAASQGIDREKIRPYGDLRRRNTWEEALNALALIVYGG